MDKNASVVIPGAGENDALNIFEIALKPGATVRETLGLLGLRGYDLRNGSERPLLESDDLFVQIQEGAILYATPKMDVG
jgi:hypothetical protein